MPHKSILRLFVLLALLPFLFVRGAADKPAPPPATGQVYSDSLLSSPVRAVGSELNATAMTAGGLKWIANKGVVLSASGVTTSSPSGAHHVIPSVAGTIHIQADINPQGCGFAGLALGRGDLSNNFWPNLCLLFYLNNDGYFLNSGPKNLAPKADKTLIHANAPNHLDLLLDTTTRTVTAQINGTTIMSSVVLPPTVEVSGLTAAGFRFNEPVTAGKPAISNYRVEVVTKAASGFVPDDLYAFLALPNVPSTLTWRVTSPCSNNDVPYVISDYVGHQVAHGTATMTPDHKVTITNTFAQGYSEITFPQANETFGLEAIEPHVGPADPFFCMDSCLSWLNLNLDQRPALVKILARSGVSMARERMGMGAVNPIKGRYDWDGGRHQFDTLRKLYADNHVSVLEITHGPAHYLTPNLAPYPEDLPQFTVAMADITKHWPVWGGAEVSNEPDLRPIPAEQYVPMVKAMSYGLEKAQSSVPLVTGVFATIPPGPYFDACVANGMLDDSNAVSFHSYDRAPAVLGMVGRYRTWLKGAGKEAMPLWHTECGWAWKQGTDRPTEAPDAESGLEISAKAVESMACGVTRYFPFDYVFYIEGPKNFGMMGLEASPLRSMADYVTCIQALSSKKYLGDLKNLDPTVQMARVFGKDGDPDCVAVLYSGKIDPTAKIAFPIKFQQATGADGRKLAATDGSLPIPDGITYVWLKRADLGDKLKTDTDAMALYQIGQHPISQKRLISPIVLQFLADKTPSRACTLRYLITQELAHELPLNVRVQNLSQTPVKFTPEVTLPGGKPQPAAPVTVPAMGFTDVVWKIDASSALDIAETCFITVSGKSEAGIASSPLAIPFVMDGTMEQNLKRHKVQLSLPIADTTNWTPNNSGGALAKFSKASGGGWRMDMTFPGGAGGWTYPTFTLPSKLNTQLYSGFLIRARVLKPASGVAIMTVSGNKTPGFWLPDLLPSDGDWHVVFAPFAEFKPGPNGAGDQNSRIDPASWVELRVGMGAGKSTDNAMEISDLILVGGDGQ